VTSMVGRGSWPSRDRVRLAAIWFRDLLASGELIVRGDADRLASCLVRRPNSVMAYEVERLFL
jgi:hypothetical protein